MSIVVHICICLVYSPKNKNVSIVVEQCVEILEILEILFKFQDDYIRFLYSCNNILFIGNKTMESNYNLFYDKNAPKIHLLFCSFCIILLTNNYCIMQYINAYVILLLCISRFNPYVYVVKLI